LSQEMATRMANLAETVHKSRKNGAKQYFVAPRRSPL
jgi:hypothetical protein